jgi:hypothetical protein
MSPSTRVVMACFLSCAILAETASSQTITDVQPAGSPQGRLRPPATQRPPVDSNTWPGVFEPTHLLTLNLTMDPGDWVLIQTDETFDIEVAAMFWAESETPIPVSVRRKSAEALDSGAGFMKVSLKIDINDFVVDQEWRDLVKLSLENGDDEDVISEGLIWNFHRLASGNRGYGYAAALASWVRVNINGVYTGVYVNAEQRDQQFLVNRGLYTPGETWLYKHDSLNTVDKKVGPDGDGPAFTALCYAPFVPASPPCATPDNATLEAELPMYINMRALLTMEAVNALMTNPDSLFSHGQNCHFAEFLTSPLRMYFPWDLDSAIRGGSLAQTIFPAGPYDVILDHPVFRAQYKQILADLMRGPLRTEKMIALLDRVEPVLNAALEADPNNQLSSNRTVAERFDEIRNWIPARVENARAQIAAD